uniref:ShKT domain-containing protein n=1 Tax=Setaria digitata TaxID=48799 RepID=A0A915Q2Y2_9BILA
MIIQTILLCIIFHSYFIGNIAQLEVPISFPAIPRSGQIVDRQSSSFSSISLHRSHAKENFKKLPKTGEKYDQLARIAGSTHHSSPMFIKLINKNLSRGRAIDQQMHSGLSDSGSNGQWLFSKPKWWHSSDSVAQFNSDMNEGLDMRNEISKLRKLDGAETSCILNGKKQKFANFKENLHFWNLSLEPTDSAQHPLDILHISMINRKCSTDQKSAFCCKEFSENMDDYTNRSVNICNSTEEWTKCGEFCINIDPESGRFINFTEYFCVEGNKSSISTLVDWVQTIVYNKTSVIIFGQIENAKNPELQSWARQMLQNLDTALASSEQNRNGTAILEEQTSNTVVLNQWIEFPKSNETKMEHEIAWQLLKDYQQYDENISNNVIRICITNQEMDQIICTEQYYHNMCHPDQCSDDTGQSSAICRHFSVENKKLLEMTEVSCDTLNEPIIFWDYQREASESATGIVILQLTRTTVNHSIPAAAAMQLDQQQDRNENAKEKRGKYENEKKLKNKKQIENLNNKSIAVSFSDLSTASDSSLELKSEMTDLINLQIFNQTANSDFTESGTLMEFDDATVLETTALVVMSNFTKNMPKVREYFNGTLNSTIKATNLNDTEEPGNEIQFQTNNGKPFHMDCSIEKDEFSATNCSNWAAAGYCLSNNATRFLWCRKTCLCVGPQL